MRIKTDIGSPSSSYNFTVDIDKPNVCPICNQSGDHTLVGKNINREDKIISITLECTMCYELFFAKYYVASQNLQITSYNNPVNTVLIIVYPSVQAENKIPPEIATLYPQFIEIYAQALEAESTGLHLIAGIGYRKSIEYLVKLFLIEQLPEEEDSIKKETLGQSIKRIKYPSIQNLAKAATWIGNDEAHFVRKHEDYNIEDMQKFILSLCYLIFAEVVAEQASALVDRT